MRKYKEIIKTTIIEENGEKTEKTRQFLHTDRTWQELTDEEKEKEIQKNSEIIYQDYQDMLYQDFKYTLDEIKEDFKEITFDDIYFDSCSQGSWIDKIKGFKLNSSINVFGEELWIDDVDLHIRKYIDHDFEIIVDNYYVDSDKLEKITATKKYQNWLSDLYTLVNNWIDKINEASKYMLDREYSYPYDIYNKEDAEWLENFFDGQIFTTTEERKDNE